MAPFPLVLAPLLLLGAPGSGAARPGDAGPEAIGPVLPYSYRSRDLRDGGAGHFTLHYALDGFHGVSDPDRDTEGSFALPSGYACALEGGGGRETYSQTNAPDYIERLGCSLEEGLLTLLTLGFNGGAPPPEMGRVLVIQYESGGSAYPLTVPILSGDILLKSTLNSDAAQTVPPHEIYHQLQYVNTHHSTPDWLSEGTAKWSEDCVFDAVNRYAAKVDNFLGDPGQGLFNASYNAVAFWRYISEQVGEIEPGCDVNVGFQRRLWAALGEGLGGVAAVDRALFEEGSPETMDSLFAGDFALALLLKDAPRAAPRFHFDENAEAGYDPVHPAQRVSLAPGEGAVMTQDAPSYGIFYHRVDLVGAPTRLTLQVTGPQRGRMQHVVFLIPGGAPALLTFPGAQVQEGMDVPPGATQAWVIVATTRQGGAFTVEVGASSGALGLHPPESPANLPAHKDNPPRCAG